MNVKTATPDPVQTTWSEQKSKLKTKFPTLTDSDLDFEESKKEDMFKSIETKLSKSRYELNRAIFDY